MRIRPAQWLALPLLLASPAFAGGPQVAVTNADDAGAGSLRAAINGATPGTLITFAIADVHPITLATPLPPIPANVTIDGATQPGTNCAMWPPTLAIELNGETLAAGDVLTVGGSNVTVRGLVVNSGPANGIKVGAVSTFRLTCSFVGTSPDGTQDFGNAGDGILLVGSTGAQIGGALVGDRNLISANAASGIEIDAAASGIQIEGNYIGTDASGTAALPNGIGVRVLGANNEIGGVPLLAGNLISGNQNSAISLEGAAATGNTIRNDLIGFDATGLVTLKNGGAGVDVSLGANHNTIGDPNAPPNIIHANGGGGVLVSDDASIGNAIRTDELSNNATIGIDLLGAPFEDPNDPGDADAGPNRLQNTPVFVGASLTAETSIVHATFSVDTAPANATYPLTIDLYRTDSDNEEGELYLGSTTYTAADFATGDVERNVHALQPVSVGETIVATATDADGNTSEYSNDPATLTVPEPAAVASTLAALVALATCRRRRAEDPIRSAEQ
jgi:hypothetical protein